MAEKRNAASSALDDFYHQASEETWLASRFARFSASTQRTLLPPFPSYLQIETTNICNHRCTFCAYTMMRRRKQVMAPELFDRLVSEAYALGAREIGLFSGAEPLTCKNLRRYIARCAEIGYTYIYISTNGALASHERLAGLLDAGLSSIKFSINGGSRESYLRVHGEDHFERVLDNLEFLSRYRRQLARKVFLAVSFVEHPGFNDGTYDQLVSRVGDAVDEIVYYRAANQSGQMPQLPRPAYRDCDLPFNKVHVSVEGFLRACCNDYDNLLAIEDLQTMSLAAAWQSPKFQQLRQRHLDDVLAGTLCGNCIRGRQDIPAPLDPRLSSAIERRQNGN